MDRFTELNFRHYLKVVACCQDCGHEIFEGEKVVEYGDDIFCNKECLAEHLLEIGMAQYKDAE